MAFTTANMEIQTNINAEPPLCAKGCGFFGSVQNRNMCSKCYNEFLKEELLAEPAAVAVASVENSLEATDSAAADVSSAPENSKKSSNSGKRRCESCNKRVGPLGFECRCGGLYCGTHRYPQEHSCCVDYKKDGRILLAKQNPIVKGEKLDFRI